MEKIISSALVFGLAFGILMARGAVAGETAGQVLAKLEKLSPEARQKALIKGAKKEGVVTIYTSMRQDQSTPFSKRFNKRYPFLKVNTFRTAASRQMAKVQAEFNAGRHEVDTLNTSPAGSFTHKRFGILDTYHSPAREFFDATYKDKEGYFTPLYVIPVVLGYNPSLVKPEEVPKSYEDLLDPKWKGKMLLDTDDFEWYIALLRYFGREKGLQYMKKLATQDLSMRRGRTLQTQLLMAGEQPLAIALHAHTVLDMKGKGAPINWTTLDPYFAKPNTLMLAKHAPHPYAAALYIDWALSKEGQTMITTFGRVSARRDIKQRFPELVKKKFVLTDADSIGPVLNKSIKEFQEIFMR
ncbi:MAG: extracellular solute-binding protein [Deltaproteobacteria bacterium]|nr:extracellular solute-binding protein [Deltaproteobacteria bacterium]